GAPGGPEIHHQVLAAPLRQGLWLAAGIGQGLRQQLGGGLVGRRHGVEFPGAGEQARRGGQQGDGKNRQEMFFHSVSTPVISLRTVAISARSTRRSAPFLARRSS